MPISPFKKAYTIPSSAENIDITDTGAYFTGTTIEGALQETGAQLGQIVTEKTSYGVVSGLGITAQAMPDMTVKVATGVIWMAVGTRFTPTANNALAVTAADATNPRIDIVYVNSSGVIAYLAGTPAASPAQPSTPAGGQLLARILVTAGKTSILTDDIRDLRKTIWYSPWITPTLINSWVNSDESYPAQYCIDNLGFVHVRGRVKNGTLGQNIFAFADGYRRTDGRLIMIPIDANSAYGRVVINNSGLGSIYVNAAASTSIALDNVCFAIN